MIISNHKRAVAQLVARVVRDHEVGGSNPLSPTKNTLNLSVFYSLFFDQQRITYRVEVVEVGEGVDVGEGVGGGCGVLVLTTFTQAPLIHW